MIVEGQEVLVVDANPAVQRGLDQLLRGAGLTPSVIADPERALEMATQKFYTVAVVDIDTPSTDEGLKLLAELREKSPSSALVALSSRRAFEPAVAAFRLGVDDVVLKSADQVNYLRDRVVALATRAGREEGAARLVEQVAALHDDFFKALLDGHRRALDLEEQAAGAASVAEFMGVIVVEDDGWLGGALAPALEERGGFTLTEVGTGGEALDVTGRERFQMALVKDQLMDLPGMMVARSIKAQSPDTMVLTWAPPEGDRAGFVTVVETARTIPFIERFTAVDELLSRIDELADAYHATHRERRYLTSFRQQHFELLRRYQEMKQRIVKGR